MRWVFKNLPRRRFLVALLSTLPPVVPAVTHHAPPLDSEGSVDEAIGQCQSYFKRVAVVKESVTKEARDYRISLELQPRGTLTQGGDTQDLMHRIAKINGTGKAASLVEARSLARTAFAKSFLKTVPAAKDDSYTASPLVTGAEPARTIDSGEAGTFLKTYAETWKCSPLKEQWMQKGGLFHYALSVEIPAQMQTALAAGHGISSACGVGVNRLKAKAKTEAKVGLVQRLVPLVKDAEHLLKGRSPDSALLADQTGTARGTVLVDFPADLIHEAKELFDSITACGTFETASTDSSPEAAVRTSRSPSPRPYPQYSSGQLTDLHKLPLPDCFAKTKHLPIFSRYGEILQTINDHQVTVLSAATGSGKTTQVPQFILSMFKTFQSTLPLHTAPPSVLVTQPRRIAAISVAQRIADERGEAFGTHSSVGYSVRFQTVSPSPRKAAADGKIVLCTAGILLRRLQSDPDLVDCSHLIIDEVHERDVFSDVLLMLSKGLLRRRPDLKLVLMSATLQADKFADYFAQDGFTVGRVNDIGGTNYPVQPVFIGELCEQLQQSRFWPPSVRPETKAYLLAEQSHDPAMTEGPIIRQPDLAEVPVDLVGQTIGWLHQTKPAGAILCFLPGWEEITQVQEYLHQHNLLAGSPHQLFLLHSSAPQQVSNDLFVRTPEYRKIILATNIAESSITIPDAVYVIDSGKQKINFYDAKHRMTVLETCWIARSNMKQRMGRAGRCQPGLYYSMMSEQRAERLPGYVPPELARLNLDEVCLSVRATGVSESCEHFLARAMDPPSPRAVSESVAELRALQAFDDRQQLTPLGRLLSHIPIHPRTSKMLVVASLFQCVDPVETMVAALGERLTRSTLLMEAKVALNKYLRQVSSDTHSDHLAVLKVYNLWLRGDRSMLSVFAEPGLQRLSKSRASIHSTLSSHLLQKEHDPARYNQNSANLDLLRFILTSGFYPDICQISRKRNTYRLALLRASATLNMTSVNAIPASTSTRSSLWPGGASRVEDRVAQNRKELALRPPFYIYDDLFDTGTKRIQKTTAIDPVWAVLFGERVRVISATSSAAGGLVGVSVDDWVQLRGNKESIGLLTELRVHYRNFIQFAVSKQLAGAALSPHEQHAVDRFSSFTLRLITEQTNIGRKLI